MPQNSAFLIADLQLTTDQPLSYTHHGVTELPTLVRGVDGDGRPLRTVYLPAGQLRGRIRHEAALAEMRQRGSKVKLEEAYMLALGQDLNPEPDTTEEEVRLGLQLQQRAANPFLDLFGTWKLASRLYVSHLLPRTNVLPDTVRHIRRDLDSNPDILLALDDAEQDRLYERQGKQSQASKVGVQIDLIERELRAARRSKDAAKVDELQAKLEELKIRKKTEKGDDASDNTKHLVSLQVIPAGIELLGKLTVQKPRANDLRLLVVAFDAISQHPCFGAQRARGCGEVHGQLTLRTTAGDNLATIAFGGFQPATVQYTALGQRFLDHDTLATP